MLLWLLPSPILTLNRDVRLRYETHIAPAIADVRSWQSGRRGCAGRGPLMTHTGSRPLGNGMSSHSGHRPFPVSETFIRCRGCSASVFETIASQSHFQAAKWQSALETKVAAPMLSLETVVFLQSRKRF